MFHEAAADRIKVFVSLPLTDRNGRFRGTGGEGYSGGDASSVAGPLRLGYAAGATDTGHDTWGASFVLDSRGRLNWHAIQDNAYRGIHEMTVTGKRIVEAFYGKPPARSYFEGCSAGGRQGMMEAQRYPADYDGILAGSPGINVPQVALAHVWRHVVMQEAGNDVSVCKFAAASAAAVTSCDTLDGVRDGVLENPALCRFDPRTLVGTVVNNCGTFSEADVEVITRVWQGPRRRDGSFLSYGPPPGADYGAITEFDEATRTVEVPGRLDREWFRFFLTQDPDWAFGKMSRAQYEDFWDQSVEEFGSVMTAVNADLTPFRDRGGKLIMWHGWSDHSTPAQGSIAYLRTAATADGGTESDGEIRKTVSGSRCRSLWRRRENARVASRPSHPMGRGQRRTGFPECHRLVKDRPSADSRATRLPISAGGSLRRAGRHRRCR